MLVVDASVAAKWLIDEPDTDKAVALRGQPMAAPTLIRTEIGNLLATLTRRGAISPGEAAESFALFQIAPLRIVEPDDALERAALDLALGLAHPIYDCLYLALAIRLDAALATADRRFAQAAAAHRRVRTLGEL